MPSSPDAEPELETLLEYLKRSRGFDFTGYKRPSLARRITKRMQTVPVDGYASYRDYLEANPAEFEQLFDTILINVTSFFRDAETWAYVREAVVPRLVAQKDPCDPIRIWSAGCATGEEAYTLAMLFAEALGIEAFRERVKIYATDVDEPALTAARYATYAAKAVEELPSEIVEKYFDRADARVAFRKDLRPAVVFGRNDLIQDAPISRIDVLVCRNTLMYFDTATQARIVSKLYFALNENGYLLLGRAETLLTHTNLFVPVDLKRRVFQKAARGFTARAIPVARTGVGDRQGTLVVADVTAQRQLQAELERSEHELQAPDEELETANEELQSTVEELETTNEALQSTNEDLETMNEELQTVNDELRLRSDELKRLSRFLEQIFASLREGVAVLDPDFRVLVWNKKAEELWGVRADQVQGSHFLDLEIGLPVERLRQPIRDALAMADGVTQETVLPATNRGGQGVQCRVVCTPLAARDAEAPDGVMVVMEEIPTAD